jgi:hypothetical protein
MILAAGLLGAALPLGLGAVSPQTGGGSFAVTVTNLTRGQIFSPVLAATHTDSVSLFEPGTKASAELALLAEDGDNSMLMALLAADSEVMDVQSGTGMLPPGHSETIVVHGSLDARFLSLATMLVTTNDAFAGVDSFVLPKGREAEVYALAYDAGSEANSEKCMYVPGPPCGSAGFHDPAPAEGFISVSNGIHGIGDVSPSQWDWRGPVAKVVIRRL